MVAKILSSAANFRGVNYNTNKIENGRGELMHAANFGPLEGMDNLSPEDYKNYFILVSSQNKKIENPQLHVALSCLGREYDQHQLTEMGKQWLNEMGYGENPYLIIFHNDTENNHVHLVSTRVSKKGNKINADYERIRSISAINRIIGLDEKQKVAEDIKKCFGFNYQTKAQFLLLLEKMGYSAKPTQVGVELIKYGIVVTELKNKTIEAGINKEENNQNRIAQLRGIIEKYRIDYSTELYLKTNISSNGKENVIGFTSELSEHLKQKFGADLVFHAKGKKPPYGFSIIDNAQKNVFKGGDIISLKELLSSKINSVASEHKVQDLYKVHLENRITAPDELAYYKTLVRSVVNNYGFLQEGMHNHGFDFVNKSNDSFIIDIQGNASIKLVDLLPEKGEDYQKFSALNGPSMSIEENIIQESFADISFGGSDIDDEAVLGRYRARKGMARTNRR